MIHFFIASGLIDYNFVCFRNAIQEVFEVRMQVQQASNNPNPNVGDIIQPLNSVALKE
jgi:hypothetical protein